MAAAIKPRNGKREYTDERVKQVLRFCDGVSMRYVSELTGIPKATIRTWRYGPRGERVRGL